MGIEFNIDKVELDTISSVTEYVLRKNKNLSRSTREPEVLSCTEFTAHFSSPDKDIIETQEEVYGIKPSLRIYIRMHDKTKIGDKKLVQMINSILTKDKNDLIVESNGEFPVILRKDGKVKINHDFDDGSNFPFDDLSMPVEVIHMPCQ